MTGDKTGKESPTFVDLADEARGAALSLVLLPDEGRVSEQGSERVAQELSMLHRLCVEYVAQRRSCDVPEFVHIVQAAALTIRVTLLTALDPASAVHGDAFRQLLASIGLLDKRATRFRLFESLPGTDEAAMKTEWDTADGRRFKTLIHLMTARPDDPGQAAALIGDDDTMTWLQAHPDSLWVRLLVSAWPELPELMGAEAWAAHQGRLKAQQAWTRVERETLAIALREYIRTLTERARSGHDAAAQVLDECIAQRLIAHLRESRGDDDVEALIDAVPELADLLADGS